ncbi:MAG: hypothetical protein ABL973_02055 [Micropepsaceae bacterium]
MKLLRLIAICLAVFAVASSASAEDDVRARATISASVETGFARVMFDWPTEVTGSAKVNDGVLVISFDKPFDADTGAIAKALDPYVALVRRDPDGKSLRFALKGPIRVKTTNYAIRYAFDLVPPSFRGDPPAPAAPAGVKTLSQLVVRVSERERMTRLQFDFPGKVDYSAKLSDGKLSVSFSKPAKVNLNRFDSNPPAWIKGARSRVSDGKLTVEFDVDREADYRDVSEGGDIVLLLKEPKTDQESAAEAGPAEGPPRVLVEDGVQGAAPPPRIEAEYISLPAPPRRGAPGSSTAKTDSAFSFKSDSLKLNTDGAALQNAALSGVIDPGAVEPVTSDSPLPPTLRLGQSDLTAALAPLPASSAGVPGKARAEIFGTMLRLELPYSKLPAAAIFRRGLAIWVVTETSEPMDLSGLASLPNTPARILSAVTEVSPGISAFRLEAPSTMSASAAAVGNSWVIAVGNTIPELPAQLQLVRQTVGSTTKMRAFMPGLTQVVWLKDPEAQDRIAAVMGYAPARGMIEGRRFVEFSALPSQQGLAVQAIADDLAVVVEGNEAVIARPSGLNVSAAQFVDSLATSKTALPKSVSPAAVDFVAWGKQIAPTHSETVSRYILASSETAGGMSAPRMALARYYVASGLGAEALGVLRTISHDDRTADSSIPFRVIRAIANIEMARYKEALEDMSVESLGDDPHAALWRGLAAAGARDWRLARNNLIVALKIVSRYPAEWNARSRVALAKAALALGETGTSKLALDDMPKASVSSGTIAEATLVRALNNEAFQKRDSAIALLDQLSTSPFKPVAARATLEGILLKIKAGKLKPEQAIDALEKLRFQWRGDQIELKTLTELGKLYVENNKIRDGLNTMRLAVRHFSDSDEARQTAAQMASIFETLFVGGKSDQLSPVQALTLFYDYKELTPVGSQGDEMIRKLVERLVSVDLLPQAAELLQHQVDQRLDGIAKASVATRLALIYLLDKQPSKALDAIRSSKQTRLPDELIVQRDLIEARALADTKSFEQALDLISSDLSTEADRLRADIYWDSQRWGDAAAKTEALLGTRYSDAAPLTDVERSDLMRASVAYSMAGDAASLERLRARFDVKMSSTQDAKAFAMITHTPDVTSEDYKTFVKRLASVDTLDAFLTDFKSRYGTVGKVSTN